MSPGISPYFAPNIRRSLGLLGLGLSLAGCGLAKKSDSCNLKANSLKVSAYSGDKLENLQISLVFLKGPSKATKAIGEYLQGLGVRATFFVQGSKLEKYKDALESMVEQGHRVATGGYSFTALNAAEDPVLELRAADHLIAPFAYGHQFWLYGEAGSLDDETLERLNRAGLGKYIGPIHADTGGPFFKRDDQCWQENLSVSVCAQGYFDEIIRIGHGIVPFHDQDERSRELIELLIPQLISYGHTMVRLDEIPDLRLALTQAGGIPDADKGAEVCHDYE